MSKQIDNSLDYGSAIYALERARHPYMITTQDDHLIDVASKLEAWKKKILTSTSNAERTKLEIKQLESKQQKLNLESQDLVKLKTQVALKISEAREDLKA